MTLRLLAWMVNSGRMELTHQEFVERLKRVSMTAKGDRGGVDDLVSPTRSDHPSFMTVGGHFDPTTAEYFRDLASPGHCQW